MKIECTLDELLAELDKHQEIGRTSFLKESAIKAMAGELGKPESKISEELEALRSVYKLAQAYLSDSSPPYGLFDQLNNAMAKAKEVLA